MGQPMVQAVSKSADRNADAEAQYPYSSGSERKVSKDPGYDTVRYYPASGGVERARYFRVNESGEFQEYRSVNGTASWVNASQPNGATGDPGVVRFFYSDGFLYDEKGKNLGRFGINSSAGKSELEGKQFLHTFGTLQTERGFVDYHGNTLSFGNQTALIQMGPPPGLVAAYRPSTANVLVDAKLNINGYQTDGFRQIDGDKGFEKIWVTSAEASKYTGNTYGEEQLRAQWRSPSGGWKREGNHLYNPEGTARFRLIGGEIFEGEVKVHYTLNWRGGSQLSTARISWAHDRSLVTEGVGAGPGPLVLGPGPRKDLPGMPKNSTGQTDGTGGPVVQVVPAKLPAATPAPLDEKPVVVAPATIDPDHFPVALPMPLGGDRPVEKLEKDKKQEPLAEPLVEPPPVAEIPPLKEPPPPVKEPEVEPMVELLPPELPPPQVQPFSDREFNQAHSLAKMFETIEQLRELVADIDTTFQGAFPAPPQGLGPPALMPGPGNQGQGNGPAPGAVPLPVAGAGNDLLPPLPGALPFGPQAGGVQNQGPLRLDDYGDNASSFELSERYERTIAEPLRQFAQFFRTAQARDTGTNKNPAINSPEISGVMSSADTVFGIVGFVKETPGKEQQIDPAHYARMRAMITGQGANALDGKAKENAGILPKLEKEYLQLTQNLRGPQNAVDRDRFLACLRELGKELQGPPRLRFEAVYQMIEEDLTGIRRPVGPGGVRPGRPQRRQQQGMNFALNDDNSQLGSLTLPS